jgi:hypothetical protein
MPRINKIAIVMAALVSSIALYDALVHAFTGHYSAFSDDPIHGVAWVATAGSIVHGLCYMALIAVLVRHAAVIDGGRTLRKVLRIILIGAYGAIIIVGSAITVLGNTESPLGLVATALFIPMLLVPPILGTTLLVQGDRTPSAFLLAASVAVLGLVVLLSFIAPDWAHPGYVEATVNLGLALLGIHASTTTQVPQHQPASAE